MGPTAPFAVLMFGVLEKGAVSRPNFYQSDILGDWSGYGYAYSPLDLDFAPFSPVTARATDGTPDDVLEVTMPGRSFQGVIDGSAAPLGVWSGDIPSSSARFAAAMTSDKQFVSVLAIPGTATSVEDLSYFALNRD